MMKNCPNSFNIECPATAPPVGKFRTYLPQILAAIIKNLLLVDIGMAIAFPTIVIPALRGLQPVKYPNETIHFTAEQASWFGSIGFIGQTLGSIISGWVTEPIGRKKSMMLVNIPHICAWIVLYFAQSAQLMYLSVLLIGFGTGIMEAPILTYVGEICQPSIRGILLSLSMVASMLGFQIVYLSGTLTTWRNAALVCLCVPVFSVFAIALIPETPSWLLSKDRNHEALKSLQWLRGWVPKEVVASEFKELQRCSEMSNACTACQKAHLKCNHPAPNVMARLRAMFQLGTRRPFMFMLVVFFVNQFSGLSATRPFLVPIFQTFGIPMDVNVGTIYVAAISLVGNVICMCVIRYVGKRKIYLFSIFGCAISTFVLGVYACMTFPPTLSTFNSHKEPFEGTFASYIPITMILSLAFFSNLGVYPVAFTLISEVFPFKTRGMASGVVIAISYITAFVSTKTFINLEQFLSIGGAFIFYGSVSVAAFYFMYVFMPETENRSLEEVERFFSDADRRPWDRRIKRIPKANGADRVADFFTIQTKHESA